MHEADDKADDFGIDIDGVVTGIVGVDDEDGDELRLLLTELLGLPVMVEVVVTIIPALVQ